MEAALTSEMLVSYHGGTNRKTSTWNIVVKDSKLEKYLVWKEVTWVIISYDDTVVLLAVHQNWIAKIGTQWRKGSTSLIKGTLRRFPSKCVNKFLVAYEDLRIWACIVGVPVFEFII